MISSFSPKRALIQAIVLLVLVSPISYKDAEAQYCDACVAAAVTATGLEITASLAALEALLAYELFNIGNSLATLGTTNTALLNAVQGTNSEGFKNVINEAHILQEKVQTLGVAQSIEREFGSVSTDHCYEVNSTVGLLNSDTAKAATYTNRTRAFNSEVRAAAQTGSVRRRLMSEVWPEGIDVGAYFSGSKVLSDADMEHAPMLVHLLAQKKTYPNPISRDGSNVNQAYTQLKRERDTHVSLVEDQLQKSINRNANVMDAADYVSNILEDAGVDPSEYVKGGKTSEAAVVKAIGNSTFGSRGAQNTSGVFGTELLRLLITEVGKGNYIESKNYELLSEMRMLQAVSYAKQVEDFYETSMLEALDNLN